VFAWVGLSWITAGCRGKDGSDVYLASLDALNEYRRVLVALALTSGDWDLVMHR
jgi:hypothetical protein